NYVLMLPETLGQQLGELVIVNAAYVNFPEGADVHQAQAELAKSDDVTMVLLFQELMERMNKMMESLNYIVFLVIVCAAGLAFIVVYNLTNINITERIREIATIKVLGFFKNETAAYVLRENIVLTAIGIAVGLVVGVFFHRFAISQIIVDLVSFKTQILPMSFVWSVLLTFGFNAFVSFVMGFKLEKINMAESLKSVD
ncbi:MAG: ABC transporter permease, partial [Oscillospiraceae bacterium]|nr:ABC transporter permease [Oscillospiraceae bacterium]